MESNNYEILKEFPLLQLHQIPLQGPVPPRLSQHGLDWNQPLAMSWGREKHISCKYMHVMYAHMRVTVRPLISDCSYMCVYFWCQLYRRTKKSLVWIFVHVMLICKGWNYRDTKRFYPQHPIQHAATACVRTHLLFSPFSFSSVSLSDSLFSSVTKLKRRKEWKRKTEREETANNNHRKLRAHGIRPHCSHSCDCHTTHCPVLLKYGSVSTYPRM